MYRDEEQREFARRLRHVPTGAEKRLWRLLRAEQLQGFKFRRQAAIGVYIVDFVCFAEQLVVELDGPEHAESSQLEHDRRRTAWLNSQGFRVLRFWNYQVDDDWHCVMDEILRALIDGKSNVTPPPSPALPTRGREPEEQSRGRR
jgi:very-short-patch-repair endonuclease